MTLILEERTFRPPIDIKIFNLSLLPDFQSMSYISTLVVFQISVFMYAFPLFYNLGDQTLFLSHVELLLLRRQKMKSYYETCLLDGQSIESFTYNKE